MVEGVALSGCGRGCGQCSKSYLIIFRRRSRLCRRKRKGISVIIMVDGEGVSVQCILSILLGPHRISELEKQLQRKAEAERQLEHHKTVREGVRAGGERRGGKGRMGRGSRGVVCRDRVVRVTLFC